MDTITVILVLIGACVLMLIFLPRKNIILREIRDEHKSHRGKDYDYIKSIFHNNHCDLCHSEIKTPWDRLDKTSFEYIIPNGFHKHYKIQICSTCAYIIANHGLLAIPPVFDPGTLHGNEYGTYGRRFDNKPELWKFMMKTDLFLDAYRQRYRSSVEPLSNLMCIQYDEVVQGFTNFVRYKEVKDFLDSQFYKNQEICTYCGHVIYTSKRFKQEMKEIDSDTSLDHVEKYGRKHELLKTKGEHFDIPNYFIKTDNSGIAMLHSHCIDSAIFKKQIKPFHVVICYDSIDQIKCLVK